jgi:uncharacterized protein
MHFEITGEEPEKVMGFYKKVFKWDFQKWDGPFPYWMIKTGDEKSPGIDGGLTERGGFGANTVNTIDVKDLDGMIEKVKEMGGTIVAPKMAVPGIGYMCYFKDPYDNTWGMMQDDPEAK